ncbi:hypothetical protein PQ469_10840 [Mucilaginibacter sp. KACC 22773]|uniref:hypothetical protein n=1 Tax=Mucilaginibacter sp. KACC 22773 TaxID=3025671 RepID=UPI00236659BC|nr:hypothetical protein [Mucilaginibacter sp. KACC 22773]WDF80502.1 hypothetical protein PQ469_10840 [Mucilaginibacter sp. KACC 22773]
MISLLLFLCITVVFSAIFTLSFQNMALLIPLSVINVLVMLNMVVQIFRITDTTLGIPFKLWGISLVFKLAAQFGLPFVFEYLADNLSINFNALSYISTVLEILPTFIIVFIFVKVLQGLKSQQNIQIKAGLSEIYLSDNSDKTEQW